MNYTKAFNYAADILGLGPESYPRGLSEAAEKLAENLDRTVQNTYVETGWADMNKSYPNARNVVTQTPELVVLIKKRMFSSIKENYVLENMDDTEKALIKAVKKLFENKCKQISAYERLTKSGEIIKKAGLNSSVVVSVLDAIDYSSGVAAKIAPDFFSNSPKISGFKQATSKIRETLLHNQANTQTTWLKNSKFADNADTGVIELTIVTSFNCTTSINFGGGNASFTILDPYKILTVTEQDIERAIYEISDSKFNVINGFADTLEQQYNGFIAELNEKRNSRGASPIIVDINNFSVNYNRIVILLQRYGLELTSPKGTGLREDLFKAATEEDTIYVLENLLNIITNSNEKGGYSNPRILSVAQIENFTPDEKALLEKIYENAVMISSLRQKDYSDFYSYGEKTNYIRRNMRQNFLGKQLIQPMDIVTAFINSQTIDDNAALAGIRSMFSISDTMAENVGKAMQKTISAANSVISKTVSLANQDTGDFVERNIDSLNNSVSEGVTKYLQQRQFDITNMARNTGSSLLGSLNKNIGDLKDLWGSVFGNNRTDYALETERNLLAGPDFPMYLYIGLRSYFGATDFGTCVFNGVVSTVSESGQPGNNSVSVSCKDNCYYFDLSLYQEKPAVNQFNGHLFNPLTPFDTEFDEATGKVNFDSNFKLLDENLQLIQSGILKYKYGRFVNQNINTQNIFNPSLEELHVESDFATEANYNVQNPLEYNSVSEDLARKIFYNPDGFVYRWKKGIGTAWIGNSSRNLVGNVLSEQNQDNSAANIIRTDPFSGQDLVNIISLLITGEPYNLNTFLNASLESGILRLTPGQTINDYITTLSRQIRRQNQIWGNFIPYKRFTVNPTFFNQVFTSQLFLKANSKKIEQLELKKAKIMQKLIQVDASFENTENLSSLQGFNYNDQNTYKTINTNSYLAINLIQEILRLDNDIKAFKAKIENSWLGLSSETKENGIRIFAEDVYSSYVGDLSSFKNETQNVYKEAFNRLRIKQNFITQRRLWQVKANNDPNLFIVADEYDHDVDIQAVVQSLGSLELINSRSFPTVSSKISAVSKLIGMEIFANSQGHIELRIPQYNKVPSSLFFKMAMRKKNFGIQYYPTFLEKTFQNRLDNVYNEIEYIEDNIRIYSTLLGYKSDKDREVFLSGSNFWSKNKFLFLTTEMNGSLLSLRAATSQIALDFTEDYETHKTIIVSTSSKGDFFERNLDESFLNNRYNYFETKYKGENANNLKNALSPYVIDNDGILQQVQRLKDIVFATTSNFDPVRRIDAINDVFQNYINVGEINIGDLDSDGGVVFPLQNLLNRQQRRTGRKIEASDFIKNKFPNSQKFTSPIDLLNIQKQLSSLVSQRYKAILAATNLIKNLDQAARANAVDSTLLSDIMLPNLTKGGNIPDFMLHMIEDETEDDFGYQSGRRYVIKQQDILSTNYNEQAPEFTTIKVQGAEKGGLVGGAGFDIGSGWETNSVWAVDYDLWRMYGFKDGGDKYMPFLSNVETQLAPYSMFLLNQQRANILQASVTRTGNEFVQPGEVYYLEDRDLLFYCEQVSHNFAYGAPGSYQTTMKLTYGHSLGEYIPTPLDVIGKTIYRGHYTNIGSYRLSNPIDGTINPGSELPLGALVFINGTIPPSNEEEAGNRLFQKNTFAQQNIKILNDIQYKIKNIVTSNLANTNLDKYAVISVRIYHSDNFYDKNLEKAAKFIINYLKNPLQNKTNDDDNNGINLKLNKERIIGGLEDSQYNIDTFRLANLTTKPNQISESSAFPTVRTPSSTAIEYAKRVAESQTGIFSSISNLFSNFEESTNVKAKQLNKAITHNIIDVWIEFINLKETEIKQSMPFISEIKDNKQTTKNEIDLNAIDEFYKNVYIKTTDDDFELGDTSGVIDIRYNDPTNNYMTLFQNKIVEEDDI